MRTRLFSVLASALALLSSCTSPWYSHRFMPAPLEVALSAEGEPSAQARALVTVTGIRRAVPSHDQPVQFEVRVRLENLGDSPVALEAEGIDLVSADMQSFGPVRVTPTPGAQIAPREAMVYDLVFPLPPGKTPDDYDLRGINLKWAVSFDGRRTITGITFQRYVVPYGYGYGGYGYDPFYPGSSVCVGVGVGSFTDD